MFKRFCVFTFLLVLGLLLVGCSAKPTATPAPAAEKPAATATKAAAQPATPTPIPPTPEPTATPAEGYPEPVKEPPTTRYPALPEEAAANWVADGVVSDGEYAHEQSVGDFALSWVNDAEHLYVAMSAPGTGWLSIGIDPENRMAGANFVIGAVTSGGVIMWDAYGLAPVGPNHPADTDVGGTDDILTAGGTEQDGTTIIEFQIPLDSGDEYDKPLASGSAYDVLIATGVSDEFSARHNFRAATEIVID